MPYHIPNADEISVTIVMSPWRAKDGLLRSKLRDDLDEYLKIIRQGVEHTVNEIMSR